MTRISRHRHCPTRSWPPPEPATAAALEAVYAATAGAVYTLLRRLVRRPAIAEELLQETFVDVLEHIGAYEGRCPLPAWIRAIAVNRALMYLRSPWHRGLEWLDKDPGGADRLPAPGADHAPLDAGLERALMTLPALTRAVVWLHDVEGYTHADIGFALGRTPSFSKSQLSRAHRRLRDLLGGRKALVEVHAMHPDLSEWAGGSLRSPNSSRPRRAGRESLRHARAARRASMALPVALAAIVLVTTTGLAAWLQSAQSALTAVPAAVGGCGSRRSRRKCAPRTSASSGSSRVLPERHAMRGSTAFTVAELEDRLALVDDRLSRVALEPNAPERAERLWRERVGVMNSLVQVRYADAVGTY